MKNWSWTLRRLGIFELENLGLRRERVTLLSDFALTLSVATRSLWISTTFKPFRLRYITIDCWSIERTELGESALSSGEVKTDVVFVACGRMVIGIYRTVCRLSPSYARAA
jgi:hypothetical protein